MRVHYGPLFPGCKFLCHTKMGIFSPISSSLTQPNIVFIHHRFQSPQQLRSGTFTLHAAHNYHFISSQSDYNHRWIRSCIYRMRHAKAFRRWYITGPEQHSLIDILNYSWIGQGSSAEICHFTVTLRMQIDNQKLELSFSVVQCLGVCALIEYGM